MWYTRRPRSRRNGFVLVSVIWIVGILAAFTISVTVSVRSHALFARNSMSGVLAQAIADGMLRITAYRISYGDDIAVPDGRWRLCHWTDEADVGISVQDQSGLVDLNTASAPLILAVLEGLGLSQGEADEIATAMRDYRDADSESDLGRQEPRTYPGQAFGPKNRPFEAVEELDQLPGMTPVLFGAFRQLATVYNQQTGIDLSTSPAPLLNTLGVTRTSSAGLAFASPRTSRVFSLTVAVQTADGTRFLRRAMMELTGQPQRPFVVLDWETGAWSAPELVQPFLPPCTPNGVNWLA